MALPFLKYTFGERIIGPHGVAVIDTLDPILELPLDRVSAVGHGPDVLGELSPDLLTHQTALDPLPQQAQRRAQVEHSDCIAQ